jgi:spore germination protein KA
MTVGNSSNVQGESINNTQVRNMNLNVKAQDEPIGSNLNENISKLKAIFCSPVNVDFSVREIYIKALKRKGVLLFLQGMTNVESIERQIIAPLMHVTITEPTGEDIASSLIDRVLTGKGASRQNNVKGIVKEIVNGNAALLIQGVNTAVILATVGYEHRSVEKPISENTLKGPKEGFVESEQANRSLIRKYCRNEKLITEVMEIGNRSSSRVSIMYIADLADEKLLKNVKERLRNVEVDIVETVSILEQYIEDRTYSLVPTVLSTERPDRVGAFLSEGHVAMLLDGSPEALIVPVTFWALFQNPEDMYQRWPYGNFIRIVRLICCFIALLTLGLYIAVTSFHVDMIPTDLVLAIAASRERLPFPAFMEVLLMEMAFEILREAGVRIPTPIGPTIGIVGALILGQAAVEANVVSPILVIIVAVTGLASFAIPEISLSFMIRIARFLFLFAGAFIGFFGIASLFTICIAYLSTIQSFGVYFMSPFAPNFRSSKDFVVRPPIWKQWLRPQNINPKRDARMKKP